MKSALLWIALGTWIATSTIAGERFHTQIQDFSCEVSIVWDITRESALKVLKQVNLNNAPVSTNPIVIGGLPGGDRYIIDTRSWSAMSAICTKK